MRGEFRGLPEVGSEQFVGVVKRIRDGLPILTSRHAAVAFGIWGGLRETEIAEWLGLSIPTVHQHHGEINKRLGNGSSARLVEVALAVDRVLRDSTGRHDPDGLAEGRDG